MRIHRTSPVRDFTIFANALLRDRRLSWCAVGVLTYLLSLPDGARATIRSMAEQRKEGRMRIAAALRELEECRYLRRDVHKDRESGQLSTVYEVFGTPYDDEPRTGDGEKVQNLASGDEPPGVSGALPSGERSGRKEPPAPPSPTRDVDTEPPSGADQAPSTAGAPVSELRGRAARLLASLARSEPRLSLAPAEALRLAPLVEEWWAAGASSSEVRCAVTQGLPPRVHSAAALLENRLRRKMPTPRGRTLAAPAPPEGAVRTPGAEAFRSAARRGAVAVRAALVGGLVGAG
ncbi:hypothetical protein DY218_14760 [Streptomyces triticagri]|uniref:Helix-turn-helix domain-containing protein n=1 Tax=Streptomyces triticagri TaxID=2293568 RepID=A0A372M4V7_9ACTN|nr:hypothetical protein [Streptomyces triticagri]RFU85954.1 hypothetical protein DY218_14760 [Streptomyces triticagri]